MIDHSQHAALTGDIIASRTAAPAAVEASLAVLADTAVALGRQLDQDLRFTRSRGDGWQVLLSDPADVLLATTLFLAHLRAADTGLDTRIAIGVGPVRTIGTADLSDADGGAFYAAGTTLDTMRRARIAIDGPGATPLHKAVIALAEDLFARWTPLQAQAIALMLSHPQTQAQAARVLGITPQSMHDRLTGGGYAAVKRAIKHYQGTTAHD